MKGSVVGVIALLVSPAWAAEAPAAPAREPGSPTSVLVMPIQPRGGVDKDLAEQVSAWLTANVHVPGYRVVAFREVEGAMSQEQARQISGCDQLSCAAEIAGALNTDEVLIGSLGIVGKSYLLTLTRIRSRDAAIPGRVAERFAGTETEALLDRMPAVVEALFDPTKKTAAQKAAEVQAEAVQAPRRGVLARVTPWALRAGAAASMSAGIVVVVLGGVLAATGIGVFAFDQSRSTPQQHVVSQTQGMAANLAIAAGLALAPLAVLLVMGAGGAGAASVVVP